MRNNSTKQKFQLYIMDQSFGRNSIGISYQKKLESLQKKKAVHTSWRHSVRRICQLYTKGILGDPGAESGGEGKSKRAEKYGTTKSKERQEESLGTMSYQTSSKRSPPF